MTIGIFDSGFGGLTVMRAIQDLMPHQPCVYFGDTARLPYGNRSPEAIRRFCLEGMTFLLKHKIDILVIACNTACACALDEIQKACPIPVVGVIAPGIEAVAALPDVSVVAILGTRATIASCVHEKGLREKSLKAKILNIACPLFVPLVEEGYVDHPLTKMVMHEYLRSIKEQNADTVLLACTHYPLLQEALERELGECVRLIDPAKSCAEEVRRQLSEKDILEHTEKAFHKFFVSDDPEKFRFFGAKFLRKQIEIVSEII